MNFRVATLQALIGYENFDWDKIVDTFRKEYFHPTNLGYQELPSKDNTVHAQVLRLHKLQ